MGSLGDGRVQIPSDPVIERETGSHLPRVLHIGAEVIATYSCGTHVFTTGDGRRGNGDRIDKRTSRQKAGERVGKRITGMNVMHSACRGDRFGSVSGAAAEVVFTVGADAKVSCVAIDAYLCAHFERVIRGGEGHVLAALKEDSVRLHHGAGRAIERLKQSVIELHRGVGVVGGWKSRRGTRNADGRLDEQSW